MTEQDHKLDIYTIFLYFKITLALKLEMWHHSEHHPTTSLSAFNPEESNIVLLKGRS
jgi:hypothetical protein